MNTSHHSPNADTCPDMENKTSVRQLLDGQEYPVTKGDIIKKGFDCKSAVERCLAFLHGIFQLNGCPRYTGEKITLWTRIQLLPIDNNAMLAAAQFMVDFEGMHFNAKKDLQINFQKQASLFCKAVLRKIHGGGPNQCYVLT